MFVKENGLLFFIYEWDPLSSPKRHLPLSNCRSRHCGSLVNKTSMIGRKAATNHYWHITNIWGCLKIGNPPKWLVPIYFLFKLNQPKKAPSQNTHTHHMDPENDKPQFQHPFVELHGADFQKWSLERMRVMAPRWDTFGRMGILLEGSESGAFVYFDFMFCVYLCLFICLSACLPFCLSTCLFVKGFANESDMTAGTFT